LYQAPGGYDRIVTAPPPPPPPGDPEDPTLVRRADEPTVVAPPYAGSRRVVAEEEAGPPPPVIRPYPWWLWGLVALFAALAVLFLVLWLTQRDNGKDVPSLVGMRQAEAQNKASSHGFSVTFVPRVSSESPGTVIDQAPEGGSSLSGSTKLIAVVAAGQSKTSVPNLVGSTQDSATSVLDSQGLKAQTNTVTSAKPHGTVIAQSPSPGTLVAKDSTVTLSVSNGQGQVAVPAVQGKGQVDAVKAVVDAGLVPIVIAVPAHEAKGTVIAQDPAAGQKVPSGTHVRMNVSGGPQQTQTQTLTVTTAQTTTVTTATTVGTTTTP
jgi:eukaryotic-like serine/threonine-protein kinase